MRLKEILENLEGVEKIEGKTSIEIKGIVCNSKAVREGSLFVAIKGSSFNGAEFIDEAIDRGACAVVLESERSFGHLSGDLRMTRLRRVTYIYVKDARVSLSAITKRFYDDVSDRMFLIGVTGTNGKTTITYLLESLFAQMSKKTGLIGTINYRFGNRLIPAVNTTPGVVELYSLLANMSKENIRNCILEVSSHSLEQGRVDTLQFDIAVFTNLTEEHLDYHKNLENYLDAKLKLFKKIKQGGYAVINRDTAYSEKIIEQVRLEGHRIITYGIEESADVCAKDIVFSLEGLKFKLCSREGSIDIESPLIGRHNVHNILASAGCGLAMGMNLEELASGIKKLSVLPGRLEKIDCGQDFLVFVDYAHTENGLENVLKTLRELKPARLLTVFGCGGDRDRSKRPNMGRVANELSDKLFITSDNPRNEEPMAIISEIIKGITINRNNYVIEVDRFKAIKLALNEAKKGDIVLVAGKGHETYQVFKDTTVPFDDREVVRRVLSEDRFNEA